MSITDRILTTLGFRGPAIETLSTAGLKASPFPTSGTGGSGHAPGWSGSSSYSYSAFDYKQVDALGNSIVMMCENSVTSVFPEAPFAVMKRTGDGTSEPVANHPLEALVARPNPFMSADEFWMASVLDYDTMGNAYWLKVFDRLGVDVVELYPLPAGLVRARWPRDGSVYIEFYEIWNGRQWERLETREIVHFRNGLDRSAGSDSRYGLSPLAPAMRHVYTDDEGSNRAATMLRNATAGIVLTPKDRIGMTDTDKQAMKAAYEAAYGGDNAGRPMVFQIPFDVEKVAFSPKEMSISEFQDKAEERISGLLRVPAIVAGLGVGLKHMTYENFEQAKRLLWEGNIVVKQRAMCRKIDMQLLPDFEPKGGFLTTFDTSQVAALQESRKDAEERAGRAFSYGGLELNEYRARLGEGPVEGDAGAVIFVPNTHTPTPVAELAAPPSPKPPDVPSDPDTQVAELEALASKRLPSLFVAGYLAAKADDATPTADDWPGVKRVLADLEVPGLAELLDGEDED